MRAREEVRCILYPDSPLMPLWNGMLATLVMISAVASLGLAFPHLFAAVAYESFNLAVDVCFLCDIVVQFRTAFMHDGTWVTEARRIGRRYMMGPWFTLDVLAGFPLQRVVQAANPVAAGDPTEALLRANQLVRVFRVLRVFRLVKLNRLFTLLEEQLKLNPALVRLAKLFSGLLLLWHWVGCIWLFVGQLERDVCPAPSCPTFDLATNEWVAPPYVVGGGDGHQWVYGLFWSMSATLGVGIDIYPQTGYETAFTVFVIAFGVFMWAFLVGSATSSFRTLTPWRSSSVNGSTPSTTIWRIAACRYGCASR